MIIFLLRSGLRSTHYDVATHRPASDNYWISVDCTQTDLNHHQFVLPLNYVCIQWIGGFNPNPLGGKIMRISWVLPNQHEVCQPNRKPLSSLFGDTMAYHDVSWLWCR